MKPNPQAIADAARRMGVSAQELETVLNRGSAVQYSAGDFLFHETSPRHWLGIVLEGEVELFRGHHGRRIRVGTAGPGAILGEGAMLDDLPHTTSALSARSTTVWQVPRAVLDLVRSESPQLFYRMLGQVAGRLSERLRAATQRIAGESETTHLSGIRREHDSLGDRDLPSHAYYGVQTLRALENFPFSGVTVGHFDHFVRALAFVKKAAARTNADLGVLEPRIADAIIKACNEILEGKLRDQFVVDMIQGGAGTSTNMNANEVIANRALELLGHGKGEYAFCHPNDNVNCSQSTNDAYPTAIKLGVWFTLRDTLSALRELRAALNAKADAFASLLKMGRTENQDAVPMTLGQEFAAYGVMISDGMRYLEQAGREMLEINMGATAIGTGLNSPPGFAALCSQHLAEDSDVPVRLAGNLVEATQDSGGFSLLSGAMKTGALQLSKICNDLRWLSSGPRCGLYEIRLPAMQPGSSIMPGKVNPVIPEVVNQICYQIIGNDLTISMAAEASELELNMAEPIIAFNLFFGLNLLRNAALVLANRCIAGIEANRERCLEYVRQSIGLVTALNPVLGYERSAAIAKEALATGASVYDLVVAKGWLSTSELDERLRAESMTHPRSHR